jgi:hypothetical protein
MINQNITLTIGDSEPIPVDNFEFHTREFVEACKKTTQAFFDFGKACQAHFKMEYNDKNQRRIKRFIKKNQPKNFKPLLMPKIKQPFYRQQEQFGRW